MYQLLKFIKQFGSQDHSKHTLPIFQFSDHLSEFGTVTPISQASQVVLVVKNLPASAEDMRCGFDPCVGKILWRRVWQPTPVFLPGKSHGQRSLAGYSPWGHKESDPDVT